MPETRPPYDAVPETAERAGRIDAFIDAFDRMMRRLSATHAAAMVESQLTMSQAKVLYVVLAADTIRMSVLAARLGVALSTISGAVDRLVDLGYVDRHDDPADRRQVVVTVTTRGVAEVDRLRELNAVEVRRLLAHVADADLDLLNRAVAILAAATVSLESSAAPTGEPGRPITGGIAS